MSGNQCCFSVFNYPINQKFIFVILQLEFVNQIQICNIFLKNQT